MYCTVLINLGGTLQRLLLCTSLYILYITYYYVLPTFSCLLLIAAVLFSNLLL